MQLCRKFGQNPAKTTPSKRKIEKMIVERFFFKNKTRIKWNQQISLARHPEMRQFLKFLWWVAVFLLVSSAYGGLGSWNLNAREGISSSILLCRLRIAARTPKAAIVVIHQKIQFSFRFFWLKPQNAHFQKSQFIRKYWFWLGFSEKPKNAEVQNRQFIRKT